MEVVLQVIVNSFDIDDQVGMNNVCFALLIICLFIQGTVYPLCIFFIHTHVATGKC